jgi:allantoin racemase
MPCSAVDMTEVAWLYHLPAWRPFRPDDAQRRDLPRTHHPARLGLSPYGAALTPHDVVREPEAVTLQLEAAIAEVMATDADSVVLGGAALAGMLPRLQPASPVLLLDGIARSVKLAARAHWLTVEWLPK